MTNQPQARSKPIASHGTAFGADSTPHESYGTAFAADSMPHGGSGLARQLVSVAVALRRDGVAVVHAAERARADIQSLADYARSARSPRLIREAERLARQRPAVFLGALFVLGLATVQILRSSPITKTVQAAPNPPPQYPLDESRIPRHDRPSGYFSARAEGAITNTPRSHAVV